MQISVQTTEALRQQILDGTLQPGSRLPPERVLSEQLGISRTALRDALQTLEADGLLEAFVGRGRFVSHDVSADRSAVAAMKWIYIHRQDLEELNEVRQLLEPPAVSGMPPNRVKDVAAHARRIVDAQARAVQVGEFDEAARLDAEFHVALVNETQNGPLKILTEQLIAMAREHARALYEVPGVAENSMKQHREIVDALENGDVRLAARLVRDHQKTASRFAIDRLDAR